MGEDTQPALLTCCPGCGTTFRVSDDQLGMAGGRVRCGACERVFHALEYRVEGDSAAEPAEDINQDYIAGLLSDAPQPQPAPPTDVAFPALTRQPLLLPPLVIEPPALADPRPFWQRYRWAIGATLAMLALGLQYAWHERERFAQDLRYRPWYERACAVFGCTLAPFIDPGKIRSDSLLIREAPDRPGVLLVDAVFSNHSAYAQPWPEMEIRFSDLGGRLVAARVFMPRQYLAHVEGAPGTIAPGASQRAHLEILDPGDEAVNYEMRLHEPQHESVHAN
jgi:predicted Zn finger-like uncharacterized protein